jgi:hypothetical protein
MSQRPTRRTFLTSAALTASLTALGQAGADAPSDADVAFTEDFSGTDRTWYVRSELDHPQLPGDWDVSLTQPDSLSTPAVRYIADGRYTDGIVWAYTPLSIEPGTAYEGQISADAWSPAVCEYPYTRLQMYVGPAEPTSAAVFPDPSDVAEPEGETGGLNRSLWQTAGWTDYSFDWQSPAFETDTLYLAVGVSTRAPGRFVHYLDSIDVDLRARTDETGPTYEGVSIETVDVSTVPAQEPAITADPETGTIEVTGKMTLPTPCHDPIVANSAYDTAADELRLDIGYAADSSEICTQQLVDKGYRAVAQFSGGLPETVTVTEDQELFELDV